MPWVRPWRRKRRRHTHPDAENEESVDLSSSEHAWWSKRVGLLAGVPHGKRRKPPEPDPTPRSGFEEYFTRESLFDRSADDPHLTAESDPYGVLGVRETATWDEITDAHRRLAKLHHPDRLGQQPDDERAASDAHIRDLNIAYTELRRRRGR